jgi:hypothetical protein
MLFAAVLVCVGCRTSASNTAAETVELQQAHKKMAMIQLIIKFRDTNLDPSKDVFVNQLSQDANATLVYVRPLSGGAHVFRIASMADKKQLAIIIQRLSRRTDIEYVEEDSIMVHQKIK